MCMCCMCGLCKPKQPWSCIMLLLYIVYTCICKCMSDIYRISVVAKHVLASSLALINSLSRPSRTPQYYRNKSTFPIVNGRAKKILPSSAGKLFHIVRSKVSLKDPSIDTHSRHCSQSFQNSGYPKYNSNASCKLMKGFTKKG